MRLKAARFNKQYRRVFQDDFETKGSEREYDVIQGERTNQENKGNEI